MARTFATGNYLSATSLATMGLPLTLAAWVRRTATPGVTQCVLTAAHAAGVNDAVELRLRGTDYYVEATSVDGGSAQGAASSSAVAINTWTHACAVFTSSTNRLAYRNATSGSAGTNSSSPASLTSVAAGAFFRESAASGAFDGDVAHAAIWNVALSASEIARLYNNGIGADPRSVRPEALIAYWPFINGDGDQDYWGNAHLTATNSPTYAQHPPVLMRSRPKYVILGAAGGAPTISSVTITGTRTVSNTLTANVVTVPGTVDSIAYQWEIADDGSGTNAADLSGETAATLALTYADFASRLDANGEAYVRVGAIATVGAESSAESFSDWVRVTAGGSGVVRPIGQSVYISV